ncbi:MAG: hypothetical protein ACLUD2_03025 [Clostridium sp.]
MDYAVTVAKAKGLSVIGLTGKDGGLLGKRADVAIIVPETETFKIQELHLPIYHTLVPDAGRSIFRGVRI